MIDLILSPGGAALSAFRSWLRHLNTVMCSSWTCIDSAYVCII